MACLELVVSPEDSLEQVDSQELEVSLEHNKEDKTQLLMKSIELYIFLNWSVVY